jgi:hypothetical protein
VIDLLINWIESFYNVYIGQKITLYPKNIYNYYLPIKSKKHIFRETRKGSFKSLGFHSWWLKWGCFVTCFIRCTYGQSITWNAQLSWRQETDSLDPTLLLTSWITIQITSSLNTLDSSFGKIRGKEQVIFDTLSSINFPGFSFF